MVVLVLGHSQHRGVLVVKGGYFLGISRKELCGVLVTEGCPDGAVMLLGQVG